MSELAFLFLATFLLCLAALFNKFPLVYSDTGAYIHHGFENTVPPDRPVMYGLFLRHISLKASLWIVISVQCFLTALCIRITTGVFEKNSTQARKYFLIIAFFLSAFTAISPVVCTLLPDFLTALIALLMLTWLFSESLQRKGKSVLVILLLFALIAHTSHLLIMTLALLIMTSFRQFRHSVFRAIAVKKLKQLYVLLASGFLLAGSINFIYTGEFFISRNSALFMTAHLSDCGLMDQFLNEKCEDSNYVLCEWKGKLSGVDFLWDAQTSPLYKTGGWEHPDPGYGIMMNDFFTSPRFAGLFVVSSAKLTIKQLFLFPIIAERQHPVQGVGSAPCGQMQWRFKNETEDYLASRQNTGQLNYQLLNTAQYIIVGLSTLLLIVFFIPKTNRASMSQLYTASWFILIFLIANAAVCGVLTVAHERFGSRVIWLVPFLAALTVLKKYLPAKTSSRISQSPNGPK